MSWKVFIMYSESILKVKVCIHPGYIDSWSSKRAVSTTQLLARQGIVQLYHPNFPPTCSLVHLSFSLYPADIFPLRHSLAYLVLQVPYYSIYIFSLIYTLNICDIQREYIYIYILFGDSSIECTVNN